ncbi:MAG: hypothetical protein KU28_00270 [Sulfurovum sp. PC08-66]|nr:MAG: hypothetical protein KU28_00270 [Sulfurovum sp. PC08-66]KIM12405.1 MAG: hypothetical protein KU37_00390 [Sulfuricurvum sp. PC08-66]
MRSVDVVVVALSTPLLVGIYEEKQLIESIESSEQSSALLPKLFEELLQRYTIDSITYANGPGSFMAIKISYLFLATLEIVKGIQLFGAWAFAFNDASPIKAMGKLYFHPTPNGVVMAPLGSQQPKPFALPLSWESIAKRSDALPNYILPAV